MIDAFTTSCSPSRRAKNAMTSSGKLPNVTLSRPPMPGPVRAASSSVERPMSAAVGITPSAAATKMSSRDRRARTPGRSRRDERHQQVGPARAAQQEAPQVEALLGRRPARPCGGRPYPHPRVYARPSPWALASCSTPARAVSARPRWRRRRRGARRRPAPGRSCFSTDPAHSLADVLDTTVGDEPTRGRATGLWAEQVHAQAELERNWAAVRAWLSAQLLRRGADRITAEELTVPPGLDELLALLRLRRHADSDEFDVVVVDCAPTGETLRLLSLPDVARWWLDRVVPAQERGALDAARPFARAVLDVALPGDDVLADVTGARPRRAGDERRAARHRARVRPSRHDARAPRGRRGAPDVHLPQPLRLPGRRGRRQPRLPRGGRRVLRRLARAPGGGAARTWRRPSRPSRCCARRTSPRRSAARRCSTGSGTRRSATLDVAAILHTGAAERLELSEDAARLHLPLPLAQRGDVSLRQVGSRARRARRRLQAHAAAAARAARLERAAAPRSPTAR